MPLITSPFVRAVALFLLLVGLSVGSMPIGLSSAGASAVLDDDDDEGEDDDEDDDDGDDDDDGGSNNTSNNTSNDSDDGDDDGDDDDGDDDDGDDDDGDDDEGGENDESGYRIAVDCDYSEGNDSTDCTVSASAGESAGRISRLIVPASVLCAQPISTTGQLAEPDRPTGVTGYRTRGNDTEITLSFSGRVRPEGEITYTLRSGNAILQVSGPGFTCGPADDQRAVAERTPIRISTLFCDGNGATGARFATAASAENLVPSELFEGFDTASCVPAAEIGFSISTADGQVLIRAATDGLGEAELSLNEGVYFVTEGVSNAAGTIEVGAGEPLTLAIAIFTAVDPNAESLNEQPVANPSADDSGSSEDEQPTATVAGKDASTVSDGTGAISVQLYSCPPGTADPVEWEEVCSPAGVGAAFRLSTVDGETSTPRSVGRTDAGGVVLFGRLSPGTYKLTQDGTDWCHAQSDNVNDAGLLEARAGEQTNVLIFNCDGA